MCSCTDLTRSTLIIQDCCNHLWKQSLFAIHTRTSLLLGEQMKQLVTMKNLLLTNACRKPNALSTKEHVSSPDSVWSQTTRSKQILCWLFSLVVHGRREELSQKVCSNAFVTGAWAHWSVVLKEIQDQKGLQLWCEPIKSSFTIHTWQKIREGRGSLSAWWAPLSSAFGKKVKPYRLCSISAPGKRFEIRSCLAGV